ncbi:hypothetical protein B6S09_17630 [Oceanimonas baumannii]|uniref:Uncharacterized protein n=2 Tax=Oceanimonas baumannii TaxID=129578 RepID=A0A235C8W8_9GAMM|nr:hypothetical protein B6S09_17630 [Oceanimonas baumannii]TDW53990.1 hypothetical protein LY04_03562 [Oceanimonas baumannii]
MNKTPYRGNAIPPLPAAPKSRHRSMQTLMGFGDYAGLDPNTMQQEDADSVQYAEAQDKEFYKKDWWWDHQRIRFLNDGGMIKLMLFIIPGLIWLSFNALSLLSTNLLLENYELPADLVVFILIIFSFIWLALAIVSFPLIFNGFFKVCEVLSKPFHKQVEAGLDRALDKKCSEFNRTDGMVRLAVSAKEKFEAPFIEFDPYIESVVQSGGVYYRLMLVHRYTGKTFTKINLTGLSATQHEIFALWDMLQRFMDVTQPLPDMPRLEPFRHMDPLTAEHDRNTGRHPRFWRDLDLKAWGDNEGAKRAKAQRAFEWNKLKCQLTPQLGRISMEEYRAATIKNINARAPS